METEIFRNDHSMDSGEFSRHSDTQAVVCSLYSHTLRIDGGST